MPTCSLCQVLATSKTVAVLLLNLRSHQLRQEGLALELLKAALGRHPAGLHDQQAVGQPRQALRTAGHQQHRLAPQCDEKHLREGEGGGSARCRRRPPGSEPNGEVGQTGGMAG